jgi:hypothetical protein
MPGVWIEIISKNFMTCLFINASFGTNENDKKILIDEIYNFKPWYPNPLLWIKIIYLSIIISIDKIILSYNRYKSIFW